MEEPENKKVRKTFKEYYQDEDFKKKHLAYILTKCECSCGKQITRSNMSAHKKTAAHQKKIAEKEKTVVSLEEFNNLKSDIEELRKQIKERKN
jgi:hypothetical protein